MYQTTAHKSQSRGSGLGFWTAVKWLKNNSDGINIKFPFLKKYIQQRNPKQLQWALQSMGFLHLIPPPAESLY
jgi:hypothetical protein